MKSFEEIYQEVLPLLKKLQRQRRVYGLCKIIGYGVLQLFLLSAVGYMAIAFLAPDVLSTFMIKQSRTNANNFYYIYLFQGAFVVFLPMSFLYMRIRKQQQAILATIVKHVAPNFTFTPYAAVPKGIIDKSKLLTKQLEKNKNAYVMSEGKLEGKIDSIDIKIADISFLNTSQKKFFLYYIPGINLLAASLMYLRPLLTRRSVEDFSDFKGLFMEADFHKELSGDTVVLPDKLEKRGGFVGKMLQSMNLKRDELVHMENAEFEKEFVVYGTDQVEARYVLTPPMMERILKMRQDTGKPLMISFRQGKMYMIIPESDGIFSFKPGENVKKPAALRRMYDNVQFCVNIVSDLQLNSKLWKK